MNTFIKWLEKNNIEYRIEKSGRLTFIYPKSDKLLVDTVLYVEGNRKPSLYWTEGIEGKSIAFKTTKDMIEYLEKKPTKKPIEKPKSTQKTKKDKYNNKWGEKDIREIFNRLDEMTGADSKDVPIKINNRLKRAIARYRYFNNAKHTALDFEFGKYILNVEEKKALEDVAIHEYAHWYLNTYKGLNEGHSALFKKTVSSLGSDNTGANCTKYVSQQLQKARDNMQK